MSEPEPLVDGDGHHSGGARFWLSALFGWAIIGYGVRGLFHHRADTNPVELAAFVGAGVVGHDLLFAPLLLAVGVVVGRVVPVKIRALVQAAPIISGSLALFAFPLVRDYARVLHNPSSLPHNYSVNLALVIGAVWALVAVAGLIIWRRPNDRRG